jgi:hypothetical protein
MIHARTFAVLLMLLMLSLPAMADNLIINPGFEQRDDAGQPTGWVVENVGNEPLQFSGDHYDGAVSAMLVGDGKSHQWRQRVTDTQGIQSFYMSGWVKADHAVFGPQEGATLYGHVIYKNQPYAVATHFYIPIEPGTYDWHRIETTVQAVAHLEIEHILITVSGKLSGGALLFDGITLSEATDQTPRALLGNKIDDLTQHLRDIEQPDATVAEALDWLNKAKGKLDDDLGAAHSNWVTAAKKVSHAMWAVMYPDAMTDRTTEARMLYHGVGRTKQDSDAYLSKIELAGCNGVLLSLGSWERVIYHSDVLPVYEDWQDFDALTYFIDEAHQRGIRVYGYVATFHGSGHPHAIPGNIAHDHPDWIARRGPNPNMPLFPDPAKPQVVAALAEAYVELATRYDLDGIGLDYIRYPTDTALCFDEYNRQRILEGYGVDIMDGDVTKDADRWAKVQQYRMAAINEAIGTIRSAVRQASPDTQLIASLISDPDNARQNYGQNWAASSRYLDFGSPMNYDDASLREDMIARQRDIFHGHGTVFIPAIGGMPHVHQTWTISDWAHRVAVQRRIGCDGIIIYRIGEFDHAVAAFFGKGPFHGQATFPDEPIE